MSPEYAGLAVICVMLAAYGFILWITGDGQKSDRLHFWDDDVEPK